MSPLALPEGLNDYGVLWAAALVVVLGLFAYGWRDVARFSWKRVWAISSVCFTEALRKRVLWVTPPAVLGVIIVSQLARPGDPQDAIRQAAKFCLFASGLLVTVTAVLLACTNLPREIESRVIYTIVTKPTTRLEMVLGKVVGFARVSGAILFIMGVCTYAYLKVRTWNETAHVRSQLATLPADSSIRPTLAYYAESGFLTTKSLEQPNDLQIYGREPQGDTRWMAGGHSEYLIVPFELNDDQKAIFQQFGEQGGSIFLMTTLRVEQHAPDAEERRLIKQMGMLRDTQPASKVLGPQLPTTAPATAPADDTAPPPVEVNVRLLDDNHRPLGNSAEANNGYNVRLQKPDNPGEPWYGRLELKGDALGRLAQAGKFLAQIVARSPATQFGSGDKPVVLLVPDGRSGIQIPPRADKQGHASPPEFYSFPSRHGMQLESQASGYSPVAAYRFDAADVGKPHDGSVTFQVKVSVEKAGEYDVTGDKYARAGVEVVNRKTGFRSKSIDVTPELSRTNFVDVPFEAVAGGDFYVFVRGLTRSQWLAVQNDSVALVTADRSFLVNLVTSLLLLWLLSILVVVIAVFCSTFLSWPIAVVLTLVILLGRWGVGQLGEAIKPGIGHSIVTDFQVDNVQTVQTVSTAVEALARTLRFVSHFLPDVSEFPVMEYIERGISVPAARVGDALAVLFCYGLPMLVCSYVILRRKEVAP